ncbi:MAG: hypothetical protein HYY37_04300 [Candidatus Aenigmarchaeota archaeon]|nr:hypothetical protein [Candidatus Aenigmarchaeota archaeon]
MEDLNSMLVHIRMGAILGMYRKGPSIGVYPLKPGVQEADLRAALEAQGYCTQKPIAEDAALYGTLDVNATIISRGEAVVGVLHYWDTDVRVESTEQGVTEALEAYIV